MPESMRQELPLVVRFGDYELDSERGALFRKGVALKLQPQPLRALAFLIDRAPEIVSREMLADHIWGDGVHVDVEQSLNYCIRQIRQVLNDRPTEPKFVETLPRQGYRFIATVAREVTADRPSASESHRSPTQSIEVEGLRQEQSYPLLTEPEPRNNSSAMSRRAFVWTAGVTAVFGGGLWLGNTFWRKPRAGAMNVSVPMPQGAGAADPGRVLGPPAVAPDGSALAVSLRTSTGAHLYVRPLNANQLIPMQGTQDATHPFWSPDSQHIAFFAEGKLKRVPVGGGSVVVLCEAQKPRGGAWGSAGKIIFGLNMQAIFEIDEGGGPVTAATELDTVAGENSHRFPIFLPDGNRFLYLARNDNPDRRGIYLESMDHRAPRKRVLFADGEFNLGRDPQTEDYFLLSQQEGKIVAQRFDMRTGSLLDQPRRLLERGGVMSASNTGVLVMRTEQQASGLVWRDRSGKEAGRLAESTEFWSVALSPNGRYLAASKHDAVSGQFTVWVASLPDGQLELLSESNHADSVMWAADSNTVYYTDLRQWKFFRRSINPRGAEELVCELPGQAGVCTISPDGRYAVGELAMVSSHSEAAWIDLKLTGKSDAKSDLWHKLGPSDAYGSHPCFSPDGRWLALSSSQSGTAELYVMDFPAGLERHRISADGGRNPRWRSDSKELFYLSDRQEMMAVPISTQAQLQVGKPVRLFEAHVRTGSEGALYDVTPDGQSFLLIDGDGSGDSNIEMVLNWPSLLRS